MTRNRLGAHGVADGEAFLVPGGEHSWQAQQIAAGYELTLDPPDASGAEASPSGENRNVFCSLERANVHFR